MKRFIRYLYEYQNGKRTRNTGFVKVLEQTDTAEIQIYGREFPVAGGRALEIYLFYEEEDLCIGIWMGEIRGAQAAFGYKLSYTAEDVGGSEKFGRIGGMILRDGNGGDVGYYGAVWDEGKTVDVSRMIPEKEWKLKRSVEDQREAFGKEGTQDSLKERESAETKNSGKSEENENVKKPENDKATGAENDSEKNKKITNGEDMLSNEKCEKSGNDKIPEEKTSQEKSENTEEQKTSERYETAKDIIYKITRQELAGLPRKEWKLANNHFLLHGYYNYHHLVSFEKEGKCWIGVPGLYFPGEQRAAGAFGFNQFMKPADGEMDLEEYEIEDEEHFGYWCRPVGAVIRKEAKEKEDAAEIDRGRKIYERSDPAGEEGLED